MFVAIEWTSMSFHAFQLAADGAVLAEHKAERGTQSVADGDFAGVLRAEIGGWLAEADEILLSGMITSRNGWVETPYAGLPAGPAEIAEKGVRKEIAGLPPLLFLPGVAQAEPLPDVMRGEELTVLAAGLDDAVAILPGPHSKWVWLTGGRISAFTTFLSGEILGFLKSGSIVSKLIPAAGDAGGFAKGVEVAANGQLAGGVLRRLFSARSLVLFEQLPAPQIASYLDGLVIGAEALEALAEVPQGTEICLIGQTPLAERYCEALRLLGRSARILPRETAAGFARIVQSR
jgi:2-dehydro-3-deoxygalactonokinase